MYLTGTIVFQKAAYNADLTYWGASIYSLGGFFFFSSGLFMKKRYFCENTQLKINQSTDDSLVTEDF